MERTTSDIQQEHASKVGEVLGEFHDAVAAIRAKTKPDGGMYLDRLDGLQQRALLREQKEAAASAAHTKAREDYKVEVLRHHAEITQRRAELRPQLFGLEGSEGAATLARAAMASEGELATLMDVAAMSGNTELAKAAFVVADRKGFGDLVARYFAEVDPDAREQYQEWKALPDEEVIERQVANLSRAIPAPHNLMPEIATPLYQ